MATIRVNDVNFYYELHGKGQPLVLIAGYTCDHLFWLPVLDELQRHFQVLIFDNHAVGQTTDNGKTLSAKIMADDIFALTKALNLEKPHIVGQSMGGTIAQCIASQHANDISKLCLLNTSAKWRTAMVHGFKALLELRAKSDDFNLLFDASIPWIFGDEFLRNVKNIELLKQAVLNNPYPQSLANQARQFNVIEKFDGRAQLAKIQAETLVIYGKEDITSLPSDSQFIVDHVANAAMIALPCAHGITLEAPKALTKELINFLRD